MGPCSVCGKDTHNHHITQVIHYRIKTTIDLGQYAKVDDPAGFEKAFTGLFEKWTTAWKQNAAVRIFVHIEAPFHYEKEFTLKPDRKVGAFYEELSGTLNQYIHSAPGMEVLPEEDPKGIIIILENGGNGT